MNRMVAHRSDEWAKWVLFLTLGGFAGNFIFSLTDHAGNGFFFKVEWLPVIASAIAVGMLLAPLVMNVRQQFVQLSWAVLLLEGSRCLGFHLARSGQSARTFNPPFR